MRFLQLFVRKWLGFWYVFAEKKPKTAAVLYKTGFFFAFSVSVSLLQFLIMTFLPYAFVGLNNGPAGWPQIPLKAAGGRNFTVFGDENGWGYFIAFEIAVFVAQCVNFPLQRNVTYKSHGNVFVQAAWYFIGWVAVSVAMNCIWGVSNAFLLHWGCPQVVCGLIKTLLTGVVSLVVFFFIFSVIFPDNEKCAGKAAAKHEKFKLRGADDKKLRKAEKKADEWQKKAEKSRAEQRERQDRSIKSSLAIKYFALKNALARAEKNYGKLKLHGAGDKKLQKAEEKIRAYREKTASAFSAALAASADPGTAAATA